MPGEVRVTERDATGMLRRLVAELLGTFALTAVAAGGRSLPRSGVKSARRRGRSRRGWW